jgi:4-amino-4-deoxy-L-arabinose transferase-like glycosyltransferase
VDAAPLIAVYAKIALWMGGSLGALRILPALAGVALIALTMLITRELGGGRYAQFLAGLSILLCPAFLIMDSLLTMNAFEPVYWMGCIWVVARILRTGDSRRPAFDATSPRVPPTVDMDCGGHCGRDLSP